MPFYSDSDNGTDPSTEEYEQSASKGHDDAGAAHESAVGTGTPRPCCATGTNRCCAGYGPLGALQYLIRSAEFSDVSLAVLDKGNLKHFAAHKLVLAAHSNLFAAMFFKNGKASTLQDGPIMVDGTAESLQVAIQYMYGGSFDVSDHELQLHVWALAHRFGISGLENCVTKTILESPSMATCFRALDMAKKFGRNDVVTGVLRFLSLEIDVISQKQLATALDIADVLTILQNVLVERVGTFDRRLSCVSAKSPCWSKNMYGLKYLCYCSAHSSRVALHGVRSSYKCAEDHDQAACFAFVKAWIMHDQSGRLRHAQALLKCIDLTLVGRSDIIRMCTSPIAASVPAFIKKVAQEIDRGSSFTVSRMQCKQCGQWKDNVQVSVGLEEQY